MRKVLYTILLLATFSGIATAQELNNVNIVSDGSAPTKEKALTNALRNAIEKAFGAFISSSTKIENGRLLYEEIATVSQGSIVSYQLIGEVLSPMKNEWTINITALVSPSKIIEFTKAKGIEVTFKGPQFAQNTLIEEYYKSQEPIIFNNFINQIDFTRLFSYSISIREPVLTTNFISNQRNENDPLPIHLINDNVEVSNLDKYKAVYSIPVDIDVKSNEYTNMVWLDFLHFMRVNSVGVVHGHYSLYDYDDGAIEKLNKYKESHGEAYIPLGYSYHIDKESGPMLPYFKNEDTMKLYIIFREKVKEAFEGVLAARLIKSNLGKVSDVFILPPNYGAA